LCQRKLADHVGICSVSSAHSGEPAKKKKASPGGGATRFDREDETASAEHYIAADEDIQANDKTPPLDPYTASGGIEFIAPQNPGDDDAMLQSILGQVKEASHAASCSSSSKTKSKGLSKEKKKKEVNAGGRSTRFDDQDQTPSLDSYMAADDDMQPKDRTSSLDPYTASSDIEFIASQNSGDDDSMLKSILGEVKEASHTISSTPTESKGLTKEKKKKAVNPGGRSKRLEEDQTQSVDHYRAADDNDDIQFFPPEKPTSTETQLGDDDAMLQSILGQEVKEASHTASSSSDKTAQPSEDYYLEHETFKCQPDPPVVTQLPGTMAQPEVKRDVQQTREQASSSLPVGQTELIPEKEKGKSAKEPKEEKEDGHTRHLQDVSGARSLFCYSSPVL